MASDSSAEAESYVYAPLEDAARQIRLIRIHRGLSGAVRCDFHTFWIDHGLLPRFLALSYVWGPPTSAYHVLIDGKRLNIRENLYHFLEEFCHVQEQEYIWIDQISINQGDLQERGKQVPLMADIYRQASFVVIWLGQDQRFSPAASRINATTKSSIKTRAEALSPFVENHYWTRLWIVQEVLLAKEVRIMVRPDLWIAGAALRKCTKAFVYFISNDPRHFERHAQTLDLIWGIGDNAILPFSHYLGRYSHLGCEHPLDKIYGLLGLMNKGRPPIVDYTKSVCDVFGEVMKILFLECMGLVKEKNSTFASTVHSLANNLGIGYISPKTLEDMVPDIMAASKVVDLEVIEWTMGFEPVRVPDGECKPAIQILGQPMHVLWWEVNGEKHIYYSKISHKVFRGG